MVSISVRSVGDNGVAPKTRLQDTKNNPIRANGFIPLFKFWFGVFCLSIVFDLVSKNI
jgi:hypothetical protein